MRFPPFYRGANFRGSRITLYVRARADQPRYECLYPYKHYLSLSYHDLYSITIIIRISFRALAHEYMRVTQHHLRYTLLIHTLYWFYQSYLDEICAFFQFTNARRCREQTNPNIYRSLRFNQIALLLRISIIFSRHIT